MFKDYVVIDNVLERRNLNSLIQLSRNIPYISHESSSIDGIIVGDRTLDAGGNWRGFRSVFLHEINQSLFESVFNDIIGKMFSSLGNSYELNYTVSSHLHFSPKMIEYSSDWWHEDKGELFAGVVYLTENPNLNSGTILQLNGKEVVIENVFNRLVTYRSNILHRPQGVFGDSINNARLTLTFFFKNLSISANYE